MTATQTPEALRAQAAQYDTDARESFERCDTDGFMSQWASGKMASLRRLEADIAEQGGTWAFRVPVDPATGLSVRATKRDGTYGQYWLIPTSEDRSTKPICVSVTAKTSRGLKGYVWGWVSLPAHADLVGTNAVNVHAVALPDDAWVPAGLPAHADRKDA